ncbi:hypothetical protein GDO81_014186 [Engystomops pustulosus]|uniref:Uncharacterized protein n=1 Tax=Engystomops pustulosus TaxID=76066 RepID=A0AAV7B8Q1_ENGPU|nr:hypothetical protein GDO81_014186 [Engystomops pustulosus]
MITYHKSCAVYSTTQKVTRNRTTPLSLALPPTHCCKIIHAHTNIFTGKSRIFKSVPYQIIKCPISNKWTGTSHIFPDS